MPLQDITPYRKFVDGFDLTEEQKVELIHTVWNMMESFVDRAFGLHPLQLCVNHQHVGDSHTPPERVPLSVEQQCSGVSKLP